jgi:post-segregation antitoxin (ccd killing protein)
VPSDTATIRVTRRTRDQLAAQARDRGVSLAALLAEIAHERERAAIWLSEREASRADAESPEVAREDRVWEAVIADGFQ